MAKLANVRTGDNNTNWFDSAVSGMNAGLGVAQFANQRKMDKAQMAQYERETAEWDRNDPVRTAERENKLLNAKLSKLSDTEKYNLTLATNYGNISQSVMDNPDKIDIQSQSDRTQRLLRGLGEGFDFEYVPMKGQDGSTVYEGTIKGPGGFSKKATYLDDKGLGQFLQQTRHEAGYHNVSELHNYSILENDADIVFSGLTTADKKQLGITANNAKEALSDPNFKAHISNIRGQGVTPSVYMEQLREQQRAATKHDQGTEKHGWDKEQHGVNMQLTKAQLAHASVARDEAAFRFNQYKESIPLETQKNLNELNKGTVEYFETVKGTVAGMYKADVPLIGDDGEPNGKFGYSEKLTNKINAITMLASKASDKTSPLDAIQAAMVTFEEKDAADKARAAAEEAARLEAEATAKKGNPGNTDDKDRPGHVANKLNAGFGAKRLVDAEGIAAREKAAYDDDAQAREDEARYIEEREAERQRIYNAKYRDTQGFGTSWKRQ